MQAEMFYVGVV